MALGVYVHWPFCKAICPYCDFNVHLERAINVAQWQQAFKQEIAFFSNRMRRQSIDTVFFGGGTPSLMPPDLVAAILETLDHHLGLSPQAEISLEANPAMLSRDEMLLLKTSGVTRLSLGIQSFDDGQLAFLGRSHSGVEARQSYWLARDIFPVVSFDMIYALPEQTAHSWEKALQEALCLSPDHLSAYQLTLEKRTPFYEFHRLGRFELPNEDEQAIMFDITRRVCRAHGMRQYEVSNYARSKNECRHNLNIWQGADYLGLGPGAHGRISFEETPDIRHTTLTHKKPQYWLDAVTKKGHGLEILKPLSQLERAEETLMFGLRLTEGIALARLEEINCRLNQNTVEMLVEEGHCDVTAGVLKATLKGQLVLDSILKALLA